MAKAKPRRHRGPTIADHSAIQRVLRIHARLSQNRPATAVSLAAEFEVSVRTLHRDLEVLRHGFGAPVVWDASTRTYFYDGPCDLLPIFRLTPDEALALLLASEMVMGWHGSPLGRALQNALKKLTHVMNDAIAFSPETLRSAIALTSTASAEVVREHRHFVAIFTAIRGQRELTMDYLKPGKLEEKRPVYPLRLVPFEHRWVVVAYDPRQARLRHFILARMTSLADAGRKFTRPTNIKLQDYIDNCLGSYAGEERFEIVIACDQKAADHVRADPWHASQELTPLPPDRHQLRLVLNNLMEARRRVLGWGGHMEVLSPPKLRRDVAADAAQLLAAHTADSNGLVTSA